jgi:tetratricopeptide (TPR) repeat protein
MIMSSDPSAESLYLEAQDLQRRGELEAAKARFLEVLRMEPEHAEALHSLGNIDARNGRLDEAEALIRRAIALKPLQASFVNSLGNIFKARGDFDKAAEFYAQAIGLQPDFAVAHNNLGAARLEAGDPEDAVKMILRAIELDPDYAGAFDNLGRALNNLGRHDDAASALRRAVILRPDFARAYNHLGHVLRAKGDLGEAREAFEHALRIDPDLAGARRNLATVLMASGRFEEAIDAFEASLHKTPRHVPTLLNLGIAYHTVRRFKKAAEAYRRALALEPGNALGHLNLGLVLNEQRRTDEAEAAFLEARRLAPANPDVYAELAALYEETNRLDDMRAALETGLGHAPGHPRLNLEAAKLARRDGNAEAGLRRLRAIDSKRLPPPLAEQYHYQMGYLLDRAGETEPAWRHFEAANGYAARTPRAAQVSPERFLAMLDRMQAFFADADPGTWPPAPAGDRPAPVFMLGFPRSGTTLTDVLLDGHPDIRMVEEQNTILKVVQALDGMPGGYPDSLAALDPDTIADLRRRYFSALDAAAGDAGDALLVDKMPIRTFQVGLLWRLFPDARYVFGLRHPADVVLSNFMQHYMPTDAFANFHTLEGTVRVYDGVMNLWHRYREKLPLSVHEVRYERLVEDLEGEARRLLEFLGVPWDPAVLDFTRTAEARGRINTNSYHQVTEALYRRARNRWRRYQRFLEPAMDRLAPHIETFGYER